MKRFGYIYAIIFCMMLYSCQTVNMMSIDYLVPAKLSFPSQIKRVGVVNCIGEDSNDIVELFKDSTKGYANAIQTNYILEGKPEVTTNALAEAIADMNYFDLVAVCDSVLRSNNTPADQRGLSKEEVGILVEELEVDMIVALEDNLIKASRKILPLSEGLFLGITDATTFVKVGLYLPQRNNPLIIMQASDSIFWEDIYPTVATAERRRVPNRHIIEEGSIFAGSVPIKYMLPTWKSAMRYIYESGSPEMRDAAFFVAEDNWDKAFSLWEKAYETKKGRKQARAAANISLYYEINDNLDKAEEWGLKALEIAKKVDKVSDEDMKTLEKENDVFRIAFNLYDLYQRKEDFAKLKGQMERFDDDFQPN